VKELYEEADIYFQPSSLESHGISVVEAMMFGLPCVVSNVGGLPESVKNNESGYVFNVNDIDDAVDKLTDLIFDTDKRTLMGEMGIKIFNKKFKKEIWEEKMKEVMEIRDE